MARTGISEQQVFDAANQLAQEGQPVTVAAVRTAIGSGSYSTITGVLAQWREAASQVKNNEVPAMPDSVNRALGQVWATAWKETQAGVKAEREALEAMGRDMERDRRDMLGEITRLETLNTEQGEKIQTLTAQFDEKTHALSEASQANTALTIENARLDERAKAAELRNGDLKQELAELHSRLKEISEKHEEKPKEPKTTTKAKPLPDDKPKV